MGIEVAIIAAITAAITGGTAVVAAAMKYRQSRIDAGLDPLMKVMWDKFKEGRAARVEKRRERWSRWRDR